MKFYSLLLACLAVFLGLVLTNSSCTKKNDSTPSDRLSARAAEKVYVAPGKHDEFYAFLSGGFSGQLPVYGLPSGRLLRQIPVFAVDPQGGYGYTEETKPMLETSHGFVPWDDLHHVSVSMKDGTPDGRFVFVNSNNTPRIARVDLTTFTTAEIIEIPNSGGNHGSPYSTASSEYLIASTRFSVPVPQKDVPISEFKKHFKATISFVKVDPNSGGLSLAFQILTPGINYDLASCGKNSSKDYCFLTSYNSEQAHTLLEANASQNDKDLLAVINWRLAEQCVANGAGKTVSAKYAHSHFNESTQTTVRKVYDSVRMIEVKDCPGILHYVPVPKSPHGVDVDPSGDYIATGGKLASQITVYSFAKIKEAIDAKRVEADYQGIPVLSFTETVAGVVENPCLGPLHTEYDGKGYGYTSCFITSEVVKWKIGEWTVADRIPTFYSLGHIMIPGGGSKSPWGKYLVAMNKITKDRYLPTGPELAQAAQLIDISGPKMELLLDFPTIGEPHYAQGLHADIVKENSKKIFKLEENKHPAVARTESEANVVRKGKEVFVKMTMIRSHPNPDNIEGIQVGDTVYFQVTNIEQDWDIAHGFAIFGSDNAEMLLMPGETRTLVWKPKKVGVYPFYCTDFCSALHQEMQGYIRVSAAGSNVPIKFETGKAPTAAEGEAKKTEDDKPVVRTESKGVGPITKDLNLPETIDDKLVAKGKVLFESRCVACHKFEARYVGPSLNGVTLRRRPEWIMNMIMTPDKMVSQDETAKKLLAEYVAPMANLGLTEDEARSLLEYLRKNDKK
ncbi:MAG: Sec-dependent nitrous-oxide reductase [Oligoflexia bacterium]|nr:Sec-dependent nitrous-oxide reductase [Oligoflexia bacterium]